MPFGGDIRIISVSNKINTQNNFSGKLKKPMKSDIPTISEAMNDNTSDKKKRLGSMIEKRKNFISKSR